MKRVELWKEISVATGDNVNTIGFDTLTGPAWFKKISELYEMYQLHFVRIKVVSTAASTTSGGWVAAYNTNYAERAATRTAELIAAQHGSCSNNIHSNGVVTIPAGALKGFSTNTPLRSDNNGWLFNFEVATTGVSTACSLKIIIEYNVTFRNPQL